MKHFLLLPALFTVIFSGCMMSNGFDRGALRESVSPPPVTDKDIQSVLALKPQLPNPFKLAIYLHSTDGYAYHRPVTRPFWMDHEMQVLQEYGNQLKEAGVVSEVVFIADGVVQTHSETKYLRGRGLYTAAPPLSSLRMAAAQYGADALLSINAAYSVDRYNNLASLLYWTIIGLYVVPGTQSDALVMLSGALWDVRNQYLYAVEESEGFAQRTGPAVTLDDGKAVEQAKLIALTEFGTRLTERLIRLHKNPS